MSGFFSFSLSVWYFCFLRVITKNLIFAESDNLNSNNIHLENTSGLDTTGKKYFTATEHISNFEQFFPCQSFDDLRNDPNENYPFQCLAEHCGRRIIDGVFPQEDIDKLIAIADKGMSYRTDYGGPTILDINTGYVRDSKGLDNLFIHHDQVYTSQEFEHYGKIIHQLKTLIENTFQISSVHFTAPTFITRINSDIRWQPQGVHDEYWHPHVDMNNTIHYQYSGLLYLSTYNQNFSGGRFRFVNPQAHNYFDVNFQQDLSPALLEHSQDIELTMEPKAGRIIIFSSGIENTHFLEQVKVGKRYVLSFWFTCDERKQFSIFLDGTAHVTFTKYFKDKMTLSKETFSRKYGSRIPMHMQQQQNTTTSEL